jgi:uncharacterized phiE125 gp8 family phage protein
VALRLQTDATTEIVTVAEIKAHLNLSTVGTIEDTLLTAYSKAARRYAENYTKRSFIQQVWQLTLDAFPSSTDAVYIPRSPISSTAGDVTITYLDETSGDSTTLSATGYTVDSESIPARIYPSYDNAWPTPRSVRNAVTITYTAGVSYSDVAEDVKSWVKLRVGSLYENREAMSGMETYNLPRDFTDGLLDPYVVIEVAP